jgi:hypothetical protein
MVSKSRYIVSELMDGAVRLQLPIMVQDTDGSKSGVIFALHHDEDISEAVARFCFHNSIADLFCSTLMSTVVNKISENAELHSNFFIGSNNAVRLAEAFYNEAAYDRINDIRVPIIQFPAQAKRVVIIHSCTFQEQQYDVLGDMLHRIEQSGMLRAVDGVWVINYGAERSVPLCTDSLSKTDACINNPDHVHMVQVASHCESFESPTIRFITDLSRVLSSDAQILYMHNKGASYADIPQSITDYRNMMMFFLVEKHEACYYLLRSGVLDVLGINFRSNVTGGHFLSGNFWWATAGYISSIPHYSFVNKYDAERFILAHPSPRVYVLYESGSDDINVLHPREGYTDTENKKKCINVNYCF